jgi:nitrate/TMAO reductase-like tetraheme cytochrome c subunit
VTETNIASVAAIVFAILAAAGMIGYLVKRPLLTTATKLLLLVSLGILPIAAATSGNVAGFEHTKEMEFCNGCHVMTPYVKDARNPESKSLASMHTRNPRFGGESCYVCHANYGMFGTIATKAEGTRHLYMYYKKYQSADPETAKLALYEPFPNTTCRQCHSTTLQGWLDEPEHQAVIDDVRNGTTSCASEGCHGPAHFVKGRAAP